MVFHRVGIIPSVSGFVTQKLGLDVQTFAETSGIQVRKISKVREEPGDFQYLPEILVVDITDY
jgi:hypothetical protein